MSVTFSRLRRCLATTAIAAIAAVPILVAPAATAVEPTVLTVTDPAATPNEFATLDWKRELKNWHKPVWFGSPGVARLDSKGTSVIVGDMGGAIWAFHVNDGSTVSGWPYKANGGIMSTPSVRGSGPDARIFVGVGDSTAVTKGGYLSLKANGRKAWFVQPYLQPGKRGGKRGVMSSMSVGNIQTGGDVVGGSMGQMQYALNARNGRTLKGFPWLQADTNFSTPALVDIDGKGKDYIIQGGDSTQGIAGIYHYRNGGHIRILKPRGNSGQKYGNQGLRCQYNTNQTVSSSPAVGRFLSGNRMGIVVGTGNYYKSPKPSDTNKIIAIDTNCKKVWSRTLDGVTRPSPALADVEGNGSLDVVMISEKSTVYALNGKTGKTIWTRKLNLSTNASVTTFQAPGAKFQYILAPTSKGVFILDGRNGSIVQQIGADMRMRSAATVTVNSDGRIGITMGGQGRGNRNGTVTMVGEVRHYLVNGNYAPVKTVQTKGAWPMFHHDPQLSGYAK